MTELIRVEEITINNEIVATIDARELHSKLESGRNFANWIQEKIQKYWFIEWVDFIKIHNEEMALNRFNNFVKPTLSQMKQPIEYLLKLDVAKEIAMVENNEKWRELRKYFIEVEKKFKTNLQLKSPMELVLDSIKFLEVEIQKEKDKNLLLENKIVEYSPKVAFADTVANSADVILVREYAKLLYDKEWINMWQNQLFSWFRKNGYLNKHNEAYQQYMDYFKIVETTTTSIFWTRINKTTKITWKWQLYFLWKLKEEK